ncbi:MAG: pyridoxal 5'-phosphate synthase glutaminase subunit PdxT [Candidatus Nitrosocaldus sp.]|nr:pyridoxal 5'-phosphate synthase glutaminase subunit PdxT [Candidatus Nitrosocaldus sp.]MDW7999513.1 pyridoxal 5'-phosphate synthase glutaminase subunit PdxT [Candidatus Nitrosocaldus sp.]
MGITVGVLALQGDVEENVSAAKTALNNLGMQGNVIQVKYPEHLASIDGLIIPGGESTVIGTLAMLNGSLKVIRDRINAGMPVLGTCAGMIVLAKRAYDRVVGETRQQLLNLLDVTVERNAFGRQIDSFEADLRIGVLGEKPFRGVFIRAPVVRSVGSGVDVLARLEGDGRDGSGDGGSAASSSSSKIVAVQQGNMIGTSFHPELSDTRLHEYFLRLVREYRQR